MCSEVDHFEIVINMKGRMATVSEKQEQAQTQSGSTENCTVTWENEKSTTNREHNMLLAFTHNEPAIASHTWMHVSLRQVLP